MELTRENYYTREADWEYMSCSQYQAFLDCEAKEMAKLQGRWVDKPTEALLVGNYFHSKMESDAAHDEFCRENFDKIFKTKTTKSRGTEIVGKYAPFELADKMLNTAYSDPTIRRFIDMPGNVEEIMTGTLFGMKWRIRMDKRIPDLRIIIDWKTSADIWKLSYNPETKERETFIEANGYMMRAAVYSEIEKQNTGKDTLPTFLIAAFTKQDPPGKGLYLLNHQDRYDYELEKIEKNIAQIMAVKSGTVLPRRCGKCDYCRAKAGALQIKPYYALKPENFEGYEYDYSARMDEAQAQT